MHKVCIFKQINKLVLNFLLCPKDITKRFKVTLTLLAPLTRNEVNYTPVVEVLKHHLKESNFLALR